MHQNYLQGYVPIYSPYPPYVRRYPLSYTGGYEPPEWERFEEQFHPQWLKEQEARLGITKGKEPLWWELYEEQFEPPWLQRMERRLGIPQPFDPRYDIYRRLF